MPSAAERALSVLKETIGAESPPGDWHTVTQSQIDDFARTTLDDQFIHTDPVRRCARSHLFGTTIAHGFLTLSLISYLIRSIPRPKGDPEQGRGCGHQLRPGTGPISFSCASQFASPRAANPADRRIEGRSDVATDSPRHGRNRRRAKTGLRRGLGHPCDLCVAEILEVTLMIRKSFLLPAAVCYFLGVWSGAALESRNGPGDGLATAAVAAAVRAAILGFPYDASHCRDRSAPCHEHIPREIGPRFQ